MKMLKWLAAVWLIALLAACGGGGGSAGTSGFGTGSGTTGGTGATGTTGTAAIKLTISSVNVTTAAPATVSATVTDASGNPVVKTVVSFSTSLKLGAFNVATALTDDTGTATVLLSPAPLTSAGADTVVASATVGTGAITASTGFTSAGSTASNVPTLGLSLSTTTVTAANPATVTVRLLDGSNAPVPNTVVTFSTTLGLGTFNVKTALTDATGTATVFLSPTAASTAGADTVSASASIAGTGVSASQGFQLTATNVTISSFVSSLGSSQMSPYGQTGMTLTLGSSALGVPVTVTVSSTCVTNGKATLTPASVTTTTGIANFTYKDAGCGATNSVDSVLATIGASTASASVNVSLTSPSASSIQFVSASPTTIFLKGSGYAESSPVVFKVVDLSGNALPNQSVVLTLTTLAGGLTLDGAQSVTKVSDANGLVSAIVNSGTVPTPVRVVASLTLTNPATTITTVSSLLAVAVGLPTEIGFSLSQGTLNIEGFNIDGTANTYSVIASDRMGNPVPVGTAINFVTEGGQIQPIQPTALSNGLARATTNFISAEPRPTDGRITILAYALGEESFNDTNGNNTYDFGEDFQDLGDMYINRAFNGIYDPLNDQLISLSLGGTSACVAASLDRLKLDKSIPSRAGSCDGVWGKSYVRRAVETVLSTSSARPVWFVKPAFANAGCSSINIVDNYNAVQHTYYEVGPGGLGGLTSKTGSFGFLVADANDVRLNPMAAGTTIGASATTGLTVTVDGGSPVPSTLFPNAVGLSYTFDASTTSGTINISFKSPGGLTTTIPLSVSQAPGVVCP